MSTITYVHDIIGYCRGSYIYVYLDNNYGEMIKLIKNVKNDITDRKIVPPTGLNPRLVKYYQNLYRFGILDAAMDSAISWCNVRSNSDAPNILLKLFVEGLELCLLQTMIMYHHKLLGGVIQALRRDKDLLPAQIIAYQELRDKTDMHNAVELYTLLDAAVEAVSVVRLIKTWKVYRLYNFYDVVYSKTDETWYTIPRGSVSFFDKRDIENVVFEKYGGGFISVVVTFGIYAETVLEFNKRVDGCISKVPKSAIDFAYRYLHYKYLDTGKEKYNIHKNDLYVSHASSSFDKQMIMCKVLLHS